MHPKQNGEWQKNVFELPLHNMLPWSILYYIYIYEFYASGMAKAKRKITFECSELFSRFSYLFFLFFFTSSFKIYGRHKEFVCGIICACDGRKCIL